MVKLEKMEKINGSPLKMETKFVTKDELTKIIHSNYIQNYTRFEFYKK
tara:strand:+ start:274 stop:417 length:144 start_codon:yes stop_codon:yes gene_type:complete